MTRAQAEAEIEGVEGRPGVLGEADAILAAAERRGIAPAELRRRALNFVERSRAVGLRLTRVEAAYSLANGIPGFFELEDFWNGPEGQKIQTAARGVANLAEAIGARIDVGDTVERLAIADPAELGRRAAEYADAKGKAAGAYVTVEQAIEAVRADPRAHQRAEAELAENERRAQVAEAERIAERAAAFQEGHAGTSTAAAVAAVKRGEDRLATASFAEPHVDLADPNSVARAAQNWQADQAARGIVVGTVEAVNHVIERTKA